MLSLVVLSLLVAVFSTDGTHDLKIYFDLIDLNHDGKATTDELAIFFDRFYEEKVEPLVSSSSSISSMTTSMLDKLIQRYNRNSTNNYLVMTDLKRTFYELYGLQNQVPRAIYKGLDPEQVHLSYTHNVYNQMFVSFVTRERPSSNLRPMIKYCDQGCISIGDTTTYNVNGWHYWIHYILIDNLQPGTKYNYQLGFIESDNQTILYIFSNDIWTFKRRNCLCTHMCT
jgi:hypothetical protein